MTTDPADWNTWLAANPPPNLQELATTYGGAGRIPPAAWEKYDAARIAWDAKRRNRLLGSETWTMMQGKKSKK